jgi:hypothetical protein
MKPSKANTSAATPEQSPSPIYPMTVKQFSLAFPALSEGSIRWDIYNAASNGLAKAGAIIRRGRTGRRILIDRDRYLNWMAGRL